MYGFTYLVQTLSKHCGLSPSSVKHIWHLLILCMSHFMFSIVSISYFFKISFSYLRLDCFLLSYHAVSPQICVIKTKVSIKILLHILFFVSLISSCIYFRYIQMYWVVFILAAVTLIWVSNTIIRSLLTLPNTSL